MHAAPNFGKNRADRGSFACCVVATMSRAEQETHAKRQSQKRDRDPDGAPVLERNSKSRRKEADYGENPLEPVQDIGHGCRNCAMAVRNSGVARARAFTRAPCAMLSSKDSVSNS